MSAVELEGLAYLSFFDDGSWFQVKFCFIPATFAIAKAIVASTRKTRSLACKVDPGMQVYVSLCRDHAIFSYANKRKKNWELKLMYREN